MSKPDLSLPIGEVRRIYEGVLDGDYIDFGPGEVFMTVGDRYDTCLPVLVAKDTLPQFQRMGYNIEHSFWLAEKDVTLADDETACRIRAMVQLLGECPVIVDEPLVRSV